MPWNRFRAARTERAVSGRSDDERSESTAPQRHAHRRARAGRRAHLDESGASGEVVEGPSRKDLAVGGRCVLSAAKDDVWRGWWSSACMRRARAVSVGGSGAARARGECYVTLYRQSSGSSGHASGGRCRSVASGAVEREGRVRHRAAKRSLCGSVSRHREETRGVVRRVSWGAGWGSGGAKLVLTMVACGPWGGS